MGEAITGIVGSIVIGTILSSFAKDGLIPSYMVFWITAAGFLGAIVLMFSFSITGVVFTLGWIVGAWLLKDMLGTVDFIIYLVAPIVALIIRAVLFFKSSNS
jgi:ABC-type Na+ efflux pump permease subunit